MWNSQGRRSTNKLREEKVIFITTRIRYTVRNVMYVLHNICYLLHKRDKSFSVVRPNLVIKRPSILYPWNPIKNSLNSLSVCLQ